MKIKLFYEHKKTIFSWPKKINKLKSELKIVTKKFKYYENIFSNIYDETNILK